MDHRVAAACVLGLAALAGTSSAVLAQCDPVIHPCNEHAYLPVSIREPRPTAPALPSPTPAPTQAPSPLYIRGDDLIEAFRNEGLAIERVTRKPVNEAGYTCTSFDWDIPQYGGAAKGFIMECTDETERQIVDGWITLACVLAPDKCPHSYTRANVHLGIRPVVPVEYANRYGQVLSRLD